jgi:2-keto-4-pentenoate hydratase/2-oxohepta-3-ene-1,7-dioic acid hydratase in catechol pathway
MKLGRYSGGKIGLIEGSSIYALEGLFSKLGLSEKTSMEEFIHYCVTHPEVIDQVSNYRDDAMNISEVQMESPLIHPPAIWAAASNYRAHQAEMIGRVKTTDVSALTQDELMAEIFLKPNSSITGPGGPIILPKISKHVDFECELAAVIGKTARNVSKENALDYVFGYLMCWDISIRDPWGIGRQNTRNIRKGFDTFCALGPYIVTKDEINDPHQLNLSVEQNGKTVMTAFTGDMINNLCDLIRFLSEITTLKPGTVITSGTPAGVSRLADGDHLKGTIDGIGVMELRVINEK